TVKPLTSVPLAKPVKVVSVEPAPKAPLPIGIAVAQALDGPTPSTMATAINQRSPIMTSSLSWSSDGPGVTNRADPSNSVATLYNGLAERSRLATNFCSRKVATWGENDPPMRSRSAVLARVVCSQISDQQWHDRLVTARTENHRPARPATARRNRMDDHVRS